MSLDQFYEMRCQCQTCGQVQGCRISDLTGGRAVCRGLIRADGSRQPCPGKLQPSEQQQDISHNALALLAYAIGSAGFLDSGQKRALLQRLRELETSAGTPQVAQAARAIAEELARVPSRPL